MLRQAIQVLVAVTLPPSNYEAGLSRITRNGFMAKCKTVCCVAVFIGFLFSTSVQVAAAVVRQPAQPSAIRYLNCVLGWTSVTVFDSPEQNRKGTLKCGEKVTVLEYINNFAKIRTEANVDWFVFKGAVSSSSFAQSVVPIDDIARLDAAKEQPPVMAQATSMSTGRVQQILKNLGYPVGTVDGLWGKQSIAALREFQREHDLESSGMLDERTKFALAAANTDASGPLSGQKGGLSSWRNIQVEGGNKEMDAALRSAGFLISNDTRAPRLAISIKYFRTRWNIVGKFTGQVISPVMGLEGQATLTRDGSTISLPKHVLPKVPKFACSIDGLYAFSVLVDLEIYGDNRLEAIVEGLVDRIDLPGGDSVTCTRAGRRVCSAW